MTATAPSREDIFISYSRQDQAFVRRLLVALEQRGRAAWVDREGIPPTADWIREIFSAIEAANGIETRLRSNGLTLSVER